MAVSARKSELLHLATVDGRCGDDNVSSRPIQKIACALVGAVELAAAFGIHPSHARRLARQGRLPSYKIGGQFRFDLEEVKRWCREPVGNGHEPQEPGNLPDRTESLPPSSPVQRSTANPADSRRGAGRQGNVRTNVARASGGTPSSRAKRSRGLEQRIARAIKLVPLAHPR